ncbi:response regulator [Methylotuvimicrobium sp. KM1]|uniref:response regulator n=1 Tax=Methylotuvimicrobium sp. KM1 TaxID=3377707 RepID=UPI00384A7F45
MTDSESIRILLVDDHAVVREGYRSLLEKQPGMKVVAEAADGAEAYSRFKDCDSDIAVMDISMPGQGGLEAITRIKQRCPDAKILVFSMHQNPSFAVQAIRAGALGYVTKSSAPDVLIRAIYDVYAGRVTLSADIAQVLALEKLGGDSIALQELTVREFDILRMLVDARSTEDIAQTLNISPKTVSNCHYMIKRKLGVASDIELTRLAIKMNIINLLDLS